MRTSTSTDRARAAHWLGDRTLRGRVRLCVHVGAIERIVAVLDAEPAASVIAPFRDLGWPRRQNLEQRGPASLESHSRPRQIEPVRADDFFRVGAQYPPRFVQMRVEGIGPMPQRARVMRA